MHLGVRETMAGIIGQITANARNRKDIKIVPSDKSTYYIPDFHPSGFDPLVHNKYLRNRARLMADMEINYTGYLASTSP